MSGTVTYHVDVDMEGHKLLNVGNATGQPAIADVSGTSLVLLSDVITVLGEMRTKMNTLLAELRSAGIINT